MDGEHRSGWAEGMELDGDDHPVVWVSYDEAVSYSAWLSSRERQAGRLREPLVYRLPTGFEWSVFSTCGQERGYPWGKEFPPAYGNYNSAEIEGYDDQFDRTCPVKAAGKNEWGIWGVGGNVMEWTAEILDWFHVCRGGSWGSSAQGDLMCLAKFVRSSDVRERTIGFRLVLSVPLSSGG
jgi:formylglycine-generating enzyme required for sulfatase activity